MVARQGIHAVWRQADAEVLRRILDRHRQFDPVGHRAEESNQEIVADVALGGRLQNHP